MTDDVLGLGTPLGKHGYIPARQESRFALGCDLGQSIDPTAICVVQKIREPMAEIPTDLIQKLGPARFECRHLERLPLGTSYVAVIARVAHLLATPPLKGNCDLVIDLTGIGRAIGDMFSERGLPYIGVTITGGQGETRDPVTWKDWRVSKIALVSRLQASLHAGVLKIAKSLPEANTLAAELMDFRASISDNGYAQFGARVGKHDDLVLALAIAVWHLVGARDAGFSTFPLEL